MPNLHEILMTLMTLTQKLQNHLINYWQLEHNRQPLIIKQCVALTGRNTTGPPFSVGRPTAHEPGRWCADRPRARRPAGPPSGSVTARTVRWPTWRYCASIKHFLNRTIQFYMNNVTNFHQLTSHGTTSCPTTWISYRDHRLLWRHFTLCTGFKLLIGRITFTEREISLSITRSPSKIQSSCLPC